MREPNFIRPIRSPRATRLPFVDAADDAPRQHADDLPEDDRSARRCSIQISFSSLSFERFLVGRQELARPVVDARDAAVDRRAVDVHVDRRQEDGDLLPVARRAPTARRSVRRSSPAVGRRDDDARRRRAPCARDRGRSRRRTRRAAANAAAQPRRRRRGERGGRHQRAGDERISRAIDFHGRQRSETRKGRTPRVTERRVRPLRRTCPGSAASHRRRLGRRGAAGAMFSI